MDGEDFYSVEQAADTLELTPGRVRQMLRAGDLVLSAAMACWAGERFMEKLDSVPRPDIVVAEGPVAVVGRHP